jgi:putative aldouronate transport system permease protein
MIVARSFLQNTIDEALFEAAFIDGCSDIRAFFRIVLPLSGPIISVLILFYAVGYWNSYFNALIYLSRRTLYPLQLFLREILLNNMTESMVDMDESDMSKFLVSESVKFAVVVVSSIPMLILYPFLQRFFIKGIMIGSIKG